ncbi:MAG: homoserine kinase [Arcanobacterium sp.]|nr:homoserine kinase [Arcanobacterium sp.]MDY5588519.1 homoserine kinase [Arcanobacterium sp.]
MRIVKEHARVRVPATSGNCGPGFDAIGMAHDVWDDVSATLTTGATRVTILGEGAKELPHDSSHLIVTVMQQTMERYGVPQTGIELVCRNSIQQGKGLGSSAAAIVAGLMLVRELVGGDASGFTRNTVLSLATEYEGHPDNAAPCIFGGATLSWQESSTVSREGQVGAGSERTAALAGEGNMLRGSAAPSVHTVQLAVSPQVHTTLLVPAEILPTSEARAALPQAVPHTDAVFQAARAGLLVHALEHRPDLLFEATEDRLHQSYRAAAMPRSAALLEALREAHWPAVISGAGPSILLFAEVDSPLAQAVGRQGFQVIDSRQVQGAHIVEQ